MKRRYRRSMRGLRGVLTPATATGNVLLGAGASYAGDKLASMVPAVGDVLDKFPGGAGLAVGAIAAFLRSRAGSRDDAYQVALGALLVNLPRLLDSFGLGLVSTDYMGAVIPQLGAGPDIEVMQGFGATPELVIQSGALTYNN